MNRAGWASYLKGGVAMLTTFDRCDRCGARACYVALQGEYELMLCHHHGHKHKAALEEAGWYVEDYRADLGYLASLPEGAGVVKEGGA
jgi:hypothetical protein